MYNKKIINNKTIMYIYLINYVKNNILFNNENNLIDINIIKDIIRI